MYVSNPYAVPGGLARAAMYGFSGTPNLTFDGTINHSGGQSGGSMFTIFQPYVEQRLAVSSPLIINAAYVATGQEISVSATIQVDQALGGDNQVHFLICQEGLHNQSNMVIDVLPSEPFTLTTPGQSTIVSRDFTLDSSYNLDDLRIVILVQDSISHTIHQATLASADYAGTIVVDAEPDGLNAPWRLQGPDNLNIDGNGDRSINVFYTGDYTLTFEDINGWALPEPATSTLTLNDGDTINFSGTYTDGPFALLQDGPIADMGQAEGASLVDFDGDGDLDIHVLNNGTADQLLRNDGNMVFTDVASGLIADTGAGRSSAWADFNQDGHLDVYIGRENESNLFLLGDGNGGFTPANTLGADDSGPATSVSFVDYDVDGNLDIYIARAGATNQLLRNYGDLGGGLFLFTAANDGVPSANSSGADWIDLDGDRRLDLYVVNQFNSNRLLLNLDIGFADITGTSGLGDVTNGIGSSWGDYDNDGDMDLYLANGGMADRLFENSGNQIFNQVYGDMVGNMGEGRGVVWGDFNQDTLLDIYLVRHDEFDLCMLGDGTGNFTDLPLGYAEARGAGNAVVSGDLDGDGDLDLFVTRQDQSNLILRNDIADGHFLNLDLTGSEGRTDAIGATVSLTANGVTQIRRVQAGGGYQAMQARRMHFGLGQSTMIESLVISWPDGEVQTLENLGVDQLLQVTQGGNSLSAVEDILPRRTALGRAHPNPFNPSTTISFTLAESGPTRLEIFTLDGRLVRTLVSESLAAGSHEAVWTGRDDAGRSVASGTYFFRLDAADGSRQAGRMVLVK
ncbi:hypothetical protein CSB20_13000 [bacterium DOLZORAL124_64_63]|nr:MAG: hypothetical protein CSB20_13000 [bacterium DOLZORAL124_64_63]